jgi:hypothetical protein
MIIDIPRCYSDQLPDDWKSKDLTHTSKAVFHWPPDCLWPFMDREPKKDA